MIAWASSPFELVKAMVPSHLLHNHCGGSLEIETSRR
jgi:hypothetical protein